jgi:hypothetical protein
MTTGKHFVSYMLSILAGVVLFASIAAAQSPGSFDCTRARKFLLADAIPRDDLRDWQSVLQCLLRVVAEAAPTIRSVQDLTDRQDLLKATKAIRVILDDNKEGAISYFRSIDDLDVISVLSYAARSRDPELRVNATLILGNVVDNSSLCVPMDHLYFPQIDDNGRANLLAVVSVVANYAVGDNVGNLERLAGAFGTLPDNYVETRRLLTNLRNKIDDRKARLSDSPSSAQSGLLDACARYRKQWAGDRIRYSVGGAP